MKTRNESIQRYISEGLQSARDAGIPKPFWPDHCAGYLATKLADSYAEKVIASRFSLDDPAKLKQMNYQEPWDAPADTACEDDMSGRVAEEKDWLGVG